jgi:calpain-7
MSCRERQTYHETAPEWRVAKRELSTARDSHILTPIQVLIDALLPRTADNQPLHATAYLPSPSSPSSHQLNFPWIPLSLKAYFKVLGGYDIRGSDPSPDIYAFTGWIPERISLRDGSFQREKVWRRVLSAWEEGKVMITLGTGEVVEGLVPFHAYGVLGPSRTVVVGRCIRADDV